MRWIIILFKGITTLRMIIEMLLVVMAILTAFGYIESTIIIGILVIVLLLIERIKTRGVE